MDIKFESTVPKKEDFYQLYETTGWNGRVGIYSKEDLYNAIGNSWYLIAAYNEDKFIGFGRVISDGVYQTFITDVIIHPDFQRKGIGSEIVKLLMKRCKSKGLQWIQLSAAKGKKKFYEKLGFEERDSDAPGMQIRI
ncbi:GNAT family N-acetyltransferase [Anaerovorax odorimutans]|uniref:GNAT family N-acetyltransferase n=1 Tax=Anaerovorax odorimutans TaxID=109327 RepID=UPI000424793A|nr:GNAT family N-acetyltransferase [Anaerovorax odorimutans]